MRSIQKDGRLCNLLIRFCRDVPGPEIGSTGFHEVLIMRLHQRKFLVKVLVHDPMPDAGLPQAEANIVRFSGIVVPLKGPLRVEQKFPLL